MAHYVHLCTYINMKMLTVYITFANHLQNIIQHPALKVNSIKKKNSVAFSPQANHTDRAAAAGRRS